VPRLQASKGNLAISSMVAASFFFSPALPRNPYRWRKRLYADVEHLTPLQRARPSSSGCPPCKSVISRASVFNLLFFILKPLCPKL
jgi:hypothetical protein